MRNTLASLLVLLVFAASARAGDPVADLGLFRKRYVAQGHPDPAAELKAALGAADDAWRAELERARRSRVGDRLPLRTDDALGALRLGRVLPKLLEAAGARHASLRAEIVRADELNAFTYGGDRLYVTDTMLRKLNDAELAAVLAHELGHVLAWHGARKEAFQKRLRAPAGESVLALRLFSRICEAEADALAIVLLKRAGLEPVTTQFELFAAQRPDLVHVQAQIPPAQASVARLEAEEIRLNAELERSGSAAAFEQLGRVMEQLAAARTRLQELRGQRAFLTLVSQHTHPNDDVRIRFCNDAAAGRTTNPLIRYVLQAMGTTPAAPAKAPIVLKR